MAKKPLIRFFVKIYRKNIIFSRRGATSAAHPPLVYDVFLYCVVLKELRIKELRKQPPKQPLNNTKQSPRNIKILKAHTLEEWVAPIHKEHQQGTMLPAA